MSSLFIFIPFVVDMPRETFSIRVALCCVREPGHSFSGNNPCMLLVLMVAICQFHVTLANETSKQPNMIINCTRSCPSSSTLLPPPPLPSPSPSLSSGRPAAGSSAPVAYKCHLFVIHTAIYFILSHTVRASNERSESDERTICLVPIYHGRGRRHR